MELYNKKEDCYGCGRCQAVCIEHAIVMAEDEEGFLYPSISGEKCIGCGRCVDACKDVHTIEGKDGIYYAVRCQNEELLKKSTSGGAFSLIAEEILKENGTVCGACFDEKLHVIHKVSDDISEMRKSKYVQSDTCKVYTKIEKELKAGRKILFSGTPCQCQAVKEHFLEYHEQLILAAVICRGVQSPKLWERYLDYIGKDHAVTFYDFRDKSYCDDGHTVAYKVGDDMKFIPMNKDKFSRLYTKCLSLRPSCYSCQFCHTDLPFDFTIGDFWGIEHVFPDMADGKGTSLVIARGSRAQEIVDKIKDRSVVKLCEEKDCQQIALKEPAKETILRKFLFKDLAQMESDKNTDMEIFLKKYGF